MLNFSLSILLLSLLLPDVAGPRSAKEYASVRVGDQMWMLENLDTDSFRNGEAIPRAATEEEWVRAGREGKPAWCYYENNEESGGVCYGKLYNWYAVTDPRGIAPEGWHVASDAEWRRTTDFLGGEDAAGTKMKNDTGWFGKANGTNESGFSGLPGGSRDLFGRFIYGGDVAYWWTTTERSDELAWYRVIDQSPHYVYRTNYSKANGYSVRCLKD